MYPSCRKYCHQNIKAMWYTNTFALTKVHATIWWCISTSSNGSPLVQVLESRLFCKVISIAILGVLTITYLLFMATSALNRSSYFLSFFVNCTRPANDNKGSESISGSYRSSPLHWFLVCAANSWTPLYRAITQDCNIIIRDPPMTVSENHLRCVLPLGWSINLDEKFPMIVLVAVTWLIQYKSALIKVVPWHCTEDTPLPEPIKTQFTCECVGH